MQIIGRKKYQKFLAERIEDESLILVTISKEKLPTFTNNNKTASVKVNGEALHHPEVKQRLTYQNFFVATNFWLSSYQSCTRGVSVLHQR